MKESGRVAVGEYILGEIYYEYSNMKNWQKKKNFWNLRNFHEAKGDRTPVKQTLSCWKTEDTGNFQFYFMNAMAKLHWH